MVQNKNQGLSEICPSREINLYFKTAEINVQIFIDTGLDGICEGILLGIAGIEVINQDQIFGRINNPVFPDASRAVFEQFCEIIHAFAAGGYNFNDPVRRTAAALISEFGCVTDDGYIRLHVSSVVLIQKYGKWGSINLAGAVMAVNIMINQTGQPCGNSLVSP